MRRRVLLVEGLLDLAPRQSPMPGGSKSRPPSFVGYDQPIRRAIGKRLPSLSRGVEKGDTDTPP